MAGIRGVYDGATVRLLPTEEPPEVTGEVEVEVLFPSQWDATETARRRRVEAARPLVTARNAMPVLEVPIWELVEGR